MVLFPFIAILLIQSSLAFEDESYSEAINSNIYPEDIFDNDNDIEVQQRSNHFLRFGRNNNGKYDKYDEREYNDYDDFTRPTRFEKEKIEKNGLFIRYGKGEQQEHSKKCAKNKGCIVFLRFGRSVPEEDKLKKRNKRDAISDDLAKRSDGFLRFGRNSNFMRFGRNPSTFPANPSTNVNGNTISAFDLLRLQERTLTNLLMQLMAHKKDEAKSCEKEA
ncbi:hypothetical protein NQ315_013828 [Exocentrus adspersus]|uniref:Uncharacterized protein n=1 Tax=Exocentrus adspersus TaxID=1586481 RepID=A0AAV8VGW9_9CUCU|nr:hypothetical protein NQ315_013828 [Exocentrus adspersus]